MYDSVSCCFISNRACCNLSICVSEFLSYSFITSQTPMGRHGVAGQAIVLLLPSRSQSAGCCIIAACCVEQCEIHTRSWYCYLREANYCGTKFSTLLVSHCVMVYIFVCSGLVPPSQRLLVQFTLLTREHKASGRLAKRVTD